MHGYVPIHGQTICPHERFIGMANYAFPYMYFQLMPTLPLAPAPPLVPRPMQHFTPMSAVPNMSKKSYPAETPFRKKSSPVPGILRRPPSNQDSAAAKAGSPTLKQSQLPENARRKRVTFADGTWPGFTESKHVPREQDVDSRRYTPRLANISLPDRAKRDVSRNSDHHRGRGVHTDSNLKGNIPVSNEFSMFHTQNLDQSERPAHKRNHHYRTDDRKDSRRHRCSRHHNRCHWISNNITTSFYHILSMSTSLHDIIQHCFWNITYCILENLTRVLIGFQWHVSFLVKKLSSNQILSRFLRLNCKRP